MYLLELDEFVSLAQLFEVCHRLGVVEAVFMVDFTVARQLAKLRHHRQFHETARHHYMIH